ncbi:TPA: hypothetical protein NJJ53_004089 [Pseudomonas aeruginosa]|uniref:hypothetical protein n=1 Tax=Pseudomonas aeruginosa TaxID=287 RepID=UPI00044CFF21|nr:hypothetical protein [Pseudomonas aeruginosa]EIU2597763.1 hypothetical protein [Pseudomonas aeruginosa]EIU2879063.1 hypothetical protein [Pseudomonas aeruginosa]ELK4864543.1 hypothetical protein [Pseudomonas aeruginosa]ELM3769337.1 hypothetical protein [Pseudomonas aeruginosa]ELP2759871.1 hypothetical protein [Pseudomonas aeruginosa]
MHNERVILDAQSSLRYLGETVLVELGWEDYPETVWRLLRIIGVVLLAEGVRDEPHFMTVPVGVTDEFANETFWDTIRTIRVMRNRSGNVLGRIAHSATSRSGAALPARRNSSTVPANGSTGAAHP